MKRLILPLCTAMLFAIASFAQTTTDQSGSTSGTQGTQSSSPSMQGSQSGSMGNTGASEKSEKKLKGCVQQQGSQYVLETKKGNIPLTGEDVSSHVGHTVAVHGSWAGSSDASSSASASSGSTGASAENAFTVSKVDMVSDSCSMDKGMKGSSGSGTGTSNPGSQQTPQ
jgi:hypothetical protein